MLSHATDWENSPSYAEVRRGPRRHARRSSPDDLCGCGYCDWVGTSDAWTRHACPNTGPDDRPENYPIPAPKVAQLVIEILDVIELDPDTVRRVTHFDVLRLLGRPIDQPTTVAVTAELTKISARYTCVAGHLRDITRTMAGAGHEIDWDSLARETRISAQKSMRSYIARAGQVDQ